MGLGQHHRSVPMGSLRGFHCRGVSVPQGLSPSVVLVEKSVNEYVRRRMAEENMALAINVRSSILARVARCTGAQVCPECFSKCS